MNLHSPVSRQTDSSIKGSGHYDHRRSVASLSSLQQILETSHPVSCIILPTTHTHQNIKPPCELKLNKRKENRWRTVPPAPCLAVYDEVAADSTVPKLRWPPVLHTWQLSPGGTWPTPGPIVRPSRRNDPLRGTGP